MLIDANVLRAAEWQVNAQTHEAEVTSGNDGGALTPLEITRALDEQPITAVVVATLQWTSNLSLQL
jgi:hypothetical protein